MFLRKLQSVLREVFKKEKKFHTEIVHTLFLGEKRGVPPLIKVIKNVFQKVYFRAFFFSKWGGGGGGGVKGG